MSFAAGPLGHPKIPEELNMAEKEKLTLEYAARALIGAWDNGEFTEGGEPDAYIDLLREALPCSQSDASVKL
jgi:hypothetical protein